ncbi:hypothetical protein [Serratia rubidaea]|uniref:hypothetical protein n=1 Tax=Serratia rubidaea TaxID=61652 RepID=UPI001BB02171|nr:hypothetical protein [Serratia rubidaea]MBS0974075.1 hypothetical protein [Serratia rubidaea]MDC6108488.1 hypothetical protein [Serratia rubidaea]
MAKTTAQRQAEYRARRRQQGDIVRLNTEVSLIAHIALERLARYHGLTQHQMLERLLIEPDKALCKRLEGGDFRRYIDKGAA